MTQSSTNQDHEFKSQPVGESNSSTETKGYVIKRPTRMTRNSTKNNAKSSNEEAGVGETEKKPIRNLTFKKIN